MKLLKLTFNCTRFESNYSSCTVKRNENVYVAAVEALRKKERQDEMKLPPKLMVR